MDLFRFASRTHWNLIPNELSRRVSDLRGRGRDLIDLTESNPTRCGFSYPKETILAGLSQEESLLYEPTPKGLLRARAAVSRYYESKIGRALDPEQIYLTASTSEAYSFLFRLLAEPGDNILVPHPSYPLFDFLAQLNDIRLRPYALEYHAGWHIDFSSLQQAINANTRAVVVVNPNNPSGSGLDPAERESLLALCGERQLALIADEVFLDFALTPDAERLRSFAGETEVLTFCLNGISKMLGLPQMKLAWIAASGPRAWLVPAMERLEVIADIYLSVGTPIQNALPHLLDEVRGPMQSQILSRVRNNLHALDERARQTRGLCERLNADGGWCAVVSIPRIFPEEVWVLRWLENDSVLIHPGYFFDFDLPGYIVVSLLPPEEIFREAINRVFGRIEKELKGS